jgi:plasmid stability protein
MSAITIRKLPDDAKQRLRMRAASNGRSMEAEARSILLAALDEPKKVDLSWIEGLIDAAVEYGGPTGVDLPLPDRVPNRPVPDFSGPEYDHVVDDDRP